MKQKRQYITGKAAMFLFMMAAVLLSVSLIKVDVYAAAEPANVTAKYVSSTDSQVTISWNNVANESGYRIYRRASKFVKYSVLTEVGANVTTYTDKTAASAQIYQYAVRAFHVVDGKKVLGWYKEVKVTTSPASIKPTVKATSNESVDISWNKVSRADGYCIWRKKASGGSWEGVKGGPSTFTSWTDAKATLGTKYVYSVRAYKLLAGKRYYGKVVNSAAVTPMKATPKGAMTAAQKDVMKKILYAVETGGQVYGKEKYDDFTEAYTNSSTEHAVTIGAGQWYGTEAQRLLKLIYQKYPSVYKTYDKNGVVLNDVLTANWSTYRIKKTSGRAKKIVNIINCASGKKCQDELMYTQIEEYQKEAMALGVTDTKAICMCINLRHLGGYGGMLRILNKVSGTVTMEKMWKAMQGDTGTQVGAPLYKTRHEKVMKWIDQYIK